MSQIMKTYLGVFLLLSMGSFAALILSAFLTVSGALNLHASIITELEESNFAPQTAAECFDLAEANHCSLTITMYRENDTAILVRDKSEIPSEEKITLARVTLNYSLGLVGESGENLRTVTGYAR